MLQSRNKDEQQVGCASARAGLQSRLESPPAVIRALLGLVAILLSAAAQDPATAPEYADLSTAYAALERRDYDTAIQAFRKAAALAPKRAAIRKDLAYTLLKIGENEEARDVFAAAMALEPGDIHIALEYAFLCYETRKPVEARRTFERLRHASPTAAAAFENIDRPLREGIERWKQAVAASPNNFSAHEELAKLAEQRDDLPLAAEHYLAAFRLRSDMRALLLDLGRVYQQLGQQELALAALLAANRGGEPRAAEAARELLPPRYPYVYEFEAALKLDPTNVPLRREFAYLLLEMKRKPEADVQFRLLEQYLPKTELSPPPARDQVGHAKRMGIASLNKSFLNDAVRYLRAANEESPGDAEVQFRLGLAYNQLRQDREALKWFALARKSPEPAIAREADRAYRNLKPDFARLRTTTWSFPMFSSRWRDAFLYAQSKVEVRLGDLPLRPYGSLRFIGDARRIERSASVLGAYLSENSFVFAAGVSTRPIHRVVGWFEAGQALSYLGSRPGANLWTPDYRGGLSYARGWGRLLGSPTRGKFLETNADMVFVSRFNNNTLFYSQWRAGYTFASKRESPEFQWQALWHWNLTTDSKREYWANFVETGPGIQFRWRSMPPGMSVGIQALRGIYLLNSGNPRRPNYFDLRAGVWYAFTR